MLIHQVDCGTVCENVSTRLKVICANGYHIDNDVAHFDSDGIQQTLVYPSYTGNLANRKVPHKLGYGFRVKW